MTLIMRISHTRIWTLPLSIWKADRVSTLCHRMPYYSDRNHEATANSPIVHGVLGFLIIPIGTRVNTVWPGKLRWMCKLDSIFKSQLHQDSIHSMTGVFRQCGCFQVHLTVQNMIPWWKSIMLRDCIPLWIVWCMLSELKTMKLNRMPRTTWYKIQCLGRYRGSKNSNLTMENHTFGYRRTMHTSLISSGMRMSKQNRWHL